MLFTTTIATKEFPKRNVNTGVYALFGKKNHNYKNVLGFPGGSEGKEFACNPGDSGSVPGLGRSPGEGNGYPL